MPHPFAGRTGSRIRNALLQQVAQRDGWLCRMCGVNLYSGRQAANSAVLDHLRPLTMAPDKAHDLDNLQLVCKACHDGPCARIEAGSNDPEAIARQKAAGGMSIGLDGWPI